MIQQGKPTLVCRLTPLCIRRWIFKQYMKEAKSNWDAQLNEIRKKGL